MDNYLKEANKFQYLFLQNSYFANYFSPFESTSPQTTQKFLVYFLPIQSKRIPCGGIIAISTYCRLWRIFIIIRTTLPCCFLTACKQQYFLRTVSQRWCLSSSFRWQCLNVPQLVHKKKLTFLFQFPFPFVYPAKWGYNYPFRMTASLQIAILLWIQPYFISVLHSIVDCRVVVESRDTLNADLLSLFGRTNPLNFEQKGTLLKMSFFA